MISDQLQLLENAIRDFEPLFWIFSPNEPTDRLYEPDGTLYAICLDGPTEICTDRRKVTVNQGDLVIIPPAVAIDCSPPSRWFGITYTGPYPYHFRERFIQVWGFEHHPLATAENATLLHDSRHRIAFFLPEYLDQISIDQQSFRAYLRLIQHDQSADSPSVIDWSMPGSEIQFANQKFDYLIAIPPESLYLTNREAVPQKRAETTLSPEYRPSE
jgi:hypothetical protein